MPSDPHWPTAKDLLTQDIAGGFIPDKMTTEAVHMLRAEYHLCIPANFKRNLQTLRESMRAKAGTASQDWELLQSDRMVYPIEVQPSNQPYPQWSGSQAELFLRQDVSEGKNLSLKPRDLWLSRQEFQVYPLEVFWQHLYQVIGSKQAKGYWMNWQKNK